MSTQPDPASTPETAAPRRGTPRRWRRRLAITLLSLPVLLVLGVLGARWYAMHILGAREAEQVARLDREDPRWRLDEIKGDRAAVPESENAAIPAVAAAAALPADWPTKPAAAGREGQDEAWQRLGIALDLPFLNPGQRLPEAVADVLRAERDALAEPLAMARRLTAYPRGRYPLDWPGNPLETPLPHVQDARRLATLLWIDAVLRAEDGDADGALGSCRAILAVARSLGDEPLAVSQLIRREIADAAISALERALALGEPTVAALRQIEPDLAAERDHPALAIALRGERAILHNLYNGLESGAVTSITGNADDASAWPVRWAYEAPVHASSHGIALEEMSRALAIARERPADWRAGFAAWAESIDARSKESTLDKLGRLLLPDVESLAAFDAFTRARLAAAVAGVAAEQFRRREHRWPEAAADLAPDILPEPPADLLDPAGGPLRLKRFSQGLLVYSVGYDGVDDGGLLIHPFGQQFGRPPALKPYWQGGDVGLRLYDPEWRARPSAPFDTLPADVFAPERP